MALTVKQLVNRHGAFVSAVTALSVFGVLMIQQVLQFLINAVSFPEMLQYGFSFVPYLIVAIPFAIGFFVSSGSSGRSPRSCGFRTSSLAPSWRRGCLDRRVHRAGGDRIVRCGLFRRLPVRQLVPRTEIRRIRRGERARSGAHERRLTFVTTLPLGVLAGVLLWLWRKDHPPKHPLSGLIDEV